MIEGLKISYSGVRGIVGRSLDERVAARFGQAFGKLVSRRYQHPTVLVALDKRSSGPALLEQVLRGLAPYADRLLNLGVVATPTAQFAMEPFQAQATVVVTASHNPAEWNGFKFMLGPENTVLDGAQTEELFALYLESAPEGREGAVETEDVHDRAIELHLQRVLAQVDAELIRKKAFRVGLDAGGGAGEEAALRLLEELGCEIVRVTAARQSEPTPESLRELGKAVKTEQAVIGLAQDMDGDRLALVDQHGNPMGEEATLLLVTDHLLKRSGPAVVVRNLSTTHAVDELVERAGGRILETKVGEVNLSRALAEQRRAGVNTFGGEGSGGVIYPSVCLGRDSLIGMAFILEMMATTGSTISDIVKTLPLRVMDKAKLPLDDATDLQSRYDRVAAAFPAATASRVDGLKLSFSKGSWLLVRPSNTEPVVRVAAESADADWVSAAMRKVSALWV